MPAVFAGFGTTTLPTITAGRAVTDVTFPTDL